jgi:hypothetical protein
MMNDGRHNMCRHTCRIHIVAVPCTHRRDTPHFSIQATIIHFTLAESTEPTVSISCAFPNCGATCMLTIQNNHEFDSCILRPNPTRVPNNDLYLRQELRPYVGSKQKLPCSIEAARNNGCTHTMFRATLSSLSSNHALRTTYHTTVAFFLSPSTTAS